MFFKYKTVQTSVRFILVWFELFMVDKHRNEIVRISDVNQNPNNLTTEPFRQHPKLERSVWDVYCM